MRLCPYVFGTLFILVGVVLAGVGWVSMEAEQADLENAVETEGVVHDTTIEREVTRRDTDRDDDLERVETFQPIVNYSYTYAGRNYSSESVYAGPERKHDAREDAREVTDRFAPGDTVTVYVNSEEPSRAFLIGQDDTRLFQLFIAAGLGFVLIGTGAILKGL